MDDGSRPEAKTPPSCLWGCLAVFLAGIALYALGFRAVGQAAVCATFVMALAGTLRSGQFEWNFSRRTLKRRTHPVAFWCVAAITGVGACGSLWFLIKAVAEIAG